MKITFVNKEEIARELEIAGWLASASTDLKDASPAKLSSIAKHCIESGHNTVTRSMRFNFEIEGISRNCANQLVRHELGLAKCQQSQRYCNMETAGYYTPANFNKNQSFYIPTLDLFLTYEQFMQISKEMYFSAMQKGVPMEDARMVLAGASHTKINVSFNWEGLTNFCQERRCKRAQTEIRKVANTIYAQVEDVSHFLGQFLVPPCEIHGYCPEKRGCGKEMPREQALKVLNDYKSKRAK